MSRRITVVDVRATFKLYCDMLHKIFPGIGKISLEEGSKSSAIAYRVRVDGSAAPGTQHSGYIGMTAGEAYATLWTILTFWGDMEHAKEVGTYESE